MPRISVVTPSLNQGPFLEGNILSVLEQGYPDLEHIVVDGASKDSTLEVLERHPHLRWVSEEDRNMTEALNKGFRMATGQILAWLNTDDRYPPGTLHRVGEWLGPGGAKVVFGDARVEDRVRETDYVARGRPFRWPELVRFWETPYFLHQPAVFFRRELLEELGYLDESLSLAGDYELWVRLAHRYEFRYEPRVMAEIVRHPGSLTATIDAWRGEVLQVSRRYWGPRFSFRRYGHWSSWRATTDMADAWEACRRGARGRGLGRLLRAAAVRPAVLAGLTWWSILARIAVGSGAVDALKARVGRNA